MSEFVEKKALEELEKGYDDAQQTVQDQDEFERFLQRLEKKLRELPGVGSALAGLPILVSLVNSYAKREYTDIPLGSIVAIVSALLYFLSPVDAIPDVIPVIGHLDDALVITICCKLVESDLDEYTEWRKKNGKVMAN